MLAKQVRRTSVFERRIATDFQPPEANSPRSDCQSLHRGIRILVSAMRAGLVGDMASSKKPDSRANPTRLGVSENGERNRAFGMGIKRG